MDTLLGLLENHRDIALSYNQRNKEDVAQFWKKVQQKLNAAGPPFKGISEWRKVWIDQKKYVRNKAARYLELRNKSCNTVHKLSAYEAAVLNLIGTIKVPGDDVAANKCVLKQETNEPKSQKTKDETKMQQSKDATKALTATTTITVRSCNNLTKDKKALLKEKKASAENLKIIESVPSEEFRNKSCFSSNIEEKESKDMLEKCNGNMCATLAELKQEYTGVGASVEKIYQSLDQSNEFRKELLNETLRHNKEMEKLRQREIKIKVEKNNQLIKIEELKLKLLHKKE